MTRRSVGTAVTSPPGFGVPRLGPILLPASPKRPKQERVNPEFTESVLARLGFHLGLDRRLAAAGRSVGQAISASSTAASHFTHASSFSVS